MSAGQAGFWDVQDRLRALSAQGDPLEKLAATVDFELFRADLAAALGSRDRSKGGRPAFDPVLKFRMPVLQAMHGLSLTQTEYLVADRLSWMRFCRLPSSSRNGRSGTESSAAGPPATRTGRSVVEERCLLIGVAAQADVEAEGAQAIRGAVRHRD